MTFDVRIAIELLVLWVLIDSVLRAIRSDRSNSLFRGFGLLSGVTLVTGIVALEVFGLEHLSDLFRSLAELLIITLVVILQPELRRGVAQLGDHEWFGRLLKRQPKALPRLLRAIARMSKEKVGALIVLVQDTPLNNVTQSGIRIDAELNSYLLESLFYPGSTLHDGAVIVEGDRIIAARCLLPLSQNQEIDKRLGTRHRAALGMSEDTDAFVIVVSEETGKISTAVHGRLRTGLSMEQLEHTLEKALHVESDKT
ncbi:MAG: diadenylate cyclase CdaA [Planctomycetota bacterium]